MDHNMSQIESSHNENGAEQFLSFVLGNEEYGMEILKVQEIKGFSALTPIPNMPSYIRGVMNLRGTVVPVVDLRTQFSMAEVEYNQFTVIILVNIREKITGLVVDAVTDVFNLNRSAILPPPEFGAQFDTRFISGVANIGDRLVVLLNIDKLLLDDQVAMLALTN